jgi:hypothetical protein
LTFDDNDPSHTLTVAGGNVTVTGTLTLTNGPIITSDASTLIHNGATAVRTNGFVDGPLRREYPAATGTTYTFHVGEGVYSPVALANISTSGNAELTAEALNATLVPFNAATSISRNWNLTRTGAGTFTADVSFTYDQTDDVNGNEADYRLFSRESGGPMEVCGTSCVDETTNVATATGVSTFSRWTVAQAFAPTAANVSIAGRVTLADGFAGISGATVTLTGSRIAQPITLRTNPFGYYSVDGLPAGTYILSVSSKTHTFMNPAIVVDASDSVTTANFYANP